MSPSRPGQSRRRGARSGKSSAVSASSAPIFRPFFCFRKGSTVFAADSSNSGRLEVIKKGRASIPVPTTILTYLRGNLRPVLPAVADQKFRGRDSFVGSFHHLYQFRVLKKWRDRYGRGPGAGAEPAGSIGRAVPWPWPKEPVSSGGGGGYFLPAPSTKKSAPYDSRRAGLAPGPWKHLALVTHPTSKNYCFAINLFSAPHPSPKTDPAPGPFRSGRRRRGEAPADP